jgi:hypothetical protein
MTTSIKGLRVSGAIALSRNTEPSLIWISPTQTTLGVWQLGDAISIQFVATGINLTEPITYSIINGSPPDGVTLDPSTGLLSGINQDTMAQPTFTVVATSGTATVSNTFLMIIGNHPAPVWISPDEGSIIDYANVNQPVSNGVVLLAQDPFDLPVSYYIIDGELPNGVTLNSQTGVISGTYPDLDNDQEYDFTVAASNGDNYAARDFIIYVASIAPANSAVWITPPGSIGTAYELSYFTSTVQAIDPHQLPITYVLVAGNIPAGLTLNPNTGVISGTLPANPDTIEYKFIIGAHTSLHTVDRLFLLTVDFDPAPTLTDSSGNPIACAITILGSIMEGNPFSTQVYGTYNPKLSGVFTANGLPDAFSFDVDTGVISTANAPIVNGTANPQQIQFTVSLSDGIKFANATYQINDYIDYPPTFAVFANNSLGAQLANTVFDTNNDFPSSGGVNMPLASDVYNRPIIYSLETPLPSSLTFDPNTGRISGTLPATSGNNIIIPVTMSATVGSLPPLSTLPGAYPATANYTITVYNSEFPEFITPQGSLGTMIENTYATFSVLANDPLGLQVIDYGATPTVDGNTIGLPSGLTTAVEGQGNDLSLVFFGNASPLPDGVNSVTSNFTVVACYYPTGTQDVSNNFSITVVRDFPPVWYTPGGEIISVLAGKPFTVEVEGYDPDIRDYDITSPNPPANVTYNLISHDWPAATSQYYGKINLNTIQNSVTGNTVGQFSGSFPDNFIANTSYSATVALTNSRGESVEQTFVLVSLVNTAPEWITPAGSVIIEGVEQTFANAQLQAYDPEGQPVSYQLPYESLGAIYADGGRYVVSLSNTGLVSGTLPPVSANTSYSFTAYAWDGTNSFGEGTLLYSTPREFMINVAFDQPPVWQTTPTFGQVEQTYVDFPVLATGSGNQPYITYSLISGNLPPGVIFNAVSAQIVGTTPTQSSDYTYQFTLLANNGIKETPLNCNFTVYHNYPPVWNTPNSISVLGDTNFNFTFAASDPNLANGYGASLTYSIIDDSDIPIGVTISNNGSGVFVNGQCPLQLTNAVYSFTATVSDNIAPPISQTFTIFCIGDEGPVWGGSGNIPNVYENTMITTITLNAPSPEGSENIVKYALANGTSLPPYLNIGGINNSTISGMAGPVDSDTTFNFSISATDSLNLVSYQNYTLTIKHNYPVEWVTNAGNIGAVLAGYGMPISSVVATSPENYTITYSTNIATLPPGISLSNSGAFSGTIPLTLSQNQEFDFTIIANDGVTAPVSQDFSILALVNVPPTFSPPSGTTLANQFEQTNITVSVSSLDPEQQTLVSQNIASSPYLTSSITYTQTANGLGGIGGETISGKLPAVIANTTYTVVYVVNDGVQQATADYYIDVNFNSPPVWQTSPTLTTGVQSAPYPNPNNANAVLQLTAVSPGSQLSYYVSNGSLPSGLTLTSNGTISGICPFVSVNTPFAFEVTATTGIKATPRTFTIVVNVNQPPVWNTNSTLTPYLMEGAQNVTYMLNATDVNGLNIQYTFDSGTFPDNNWIFNATASASNASITGDGPLTTNAITYYYVTIGASNGFIKSDRTFTITLKENLPAVWANAAGQLASNITGGHLSVTLSATDPEGNSVTYLQNTVINSFPSWLTLTNPGNNTGVVSGTYPYDTTANVSYYFTVDAFDGFSKNPRTFSVLDIYSPAPVWTTPSGILTTQIAGSVLSNTVVARDAYGRKITYTENTTVSAWPSWVTLLSNGYIYGTFPNVSSTTSYNLYINANNGINASTQEFTLVDQFVALQLTSPSGAVSTFDGTTPIVMSQVGAWTIQFSSVPQAAYIQAWGAGGGVQWGGCGGYAAGNLNIAAGAVMVAWVGGGGQTNILTTSTKPGGFGGGGSSGPALNSGNYGGSGGGLSGVFNGSASFNNALLIAGGGGGAGSQGPQGTSGGGGGTVGGNAGDTVHHGNQNAGGFGGTQTGGGSSGTINGTGQAGGSQLQGANCVAQGSAGGGGGYWGGGAGTGYTVGTAGMGGGGGSGYVGGVSNSTLIAGANGIATGNQIGTPGMPPNTTNPNYISGVGYPSADNNDGTVAGSGLVVITMTS